METSLQSLTEIARRHGTPTYAYDVRRLKRQAEKLQLALPFGVDVLYSLKANASLGICDVLAECGLGADVASAGELAIAVEAGFPPERIFAAGPYHSPETVSQLRSLPEAVVSIDSVSELESIASSGLSNRVVLRLRPDFGSHAVVAAGKECRFGVPAEEWPRCRMVTEALETPIIGFHVFAGSQVLEADRVVDHLRGAAELSLRAADVLGVPPELVNLGGGFGTPYAPGEAELDLTPVGEELARIAEQVSPARIVLELGRFLVAQAGWYLTTVVGYQDHQGRPAVVVDGGTHQRADLCGLCLRNNARPPVVLGRTDNLQTLPTDVLGCLSLPADVLSEAAALPPLAVGDVLAFPNAGAYGWWSSPAAFHASPLPCEVAFHGEDVMVMRERKPADSVLDDQRHVRRRQTAHTT